MIRKVDAKEGAVSVEGIGAFAMAPDGSLIPPEGSALSDDDLRRIYAALPSGYEIGEAAPTAPEPAPAETALVEAPAPTETPAPAPDAPQPAPEEQPAPTGPLDPDSTKRARTGPVTPGGDT